MARITVEDSLETAKNRFALVVLTAQRTKQLLKGSKPLSERKENREIVTALREIAAAKVVFNHPEHLHGEGKDRIYIEEEKDHGDTSEES